MGVLFNATAPELWRRFTLALRRHLAKLAGLTQGEHHRRPGEHLADTGAFSDRKLSARRSRTIS
ncbi:hypothetical protein [Microbispora bryophytorum]|uniref:Uncharacterized protein n=1 Tax=Microbispora bryophytorum TaxID=1460882 RepID=A0A8H9GVC3_9ACTN|nr:hypothetical protein [Microbispora bryophytorum]MBD3139626.1 hypothetical protein [Microbispora bryophytorum]TQS02911.1 hypothetical protein FLX07_26675 [Microbispora bryophytorum]GGO03007.1 hypothetical protein GCM10011574_12390 [Microbispora bryophytorum]